MNASRIKIPSPNLVTQVSPEGLLTAATTLHECGGDLSAARFSEMTGVDPSTARRRLAHAHRLGLARARVIPIHGPVFRAVYSTSVKQQANFSMKNLVLDSLKNDPLRRVFSEAGAKSLERIFSLHYDWASSTRSRRVGSIHALADFYESTHRDLITMPDDYDAEGSLQISMGRGTGVTGAVLPREGRSRYGSMMPSPRLVGDVDDTYGIQVIRRTHDVPAGHNVVMGSMVSLTEAMRTTGATCPDCFMVISSGGGCFC